MTVLHVMPVRYWVLMVLHTLNMERHNLADDIVVLRLRGQKFVIPFKCLLRYPDTKLGDIARDILKANTLNGIQDNDTNTYVHIKLQDLKSEKSTHELKFDRDPVIFGMIQNLYLSGHIHLQNGVCIHALQAELAYWIISMDFLSL